LLRWQRSQGEAAAPQSHAFGPFHGRTGWLSQTQPVPSHLEHFMGRRIPPCYHGDNQPELARCARSHRSLKAALLARANFQSLGARNGRELLRGCLSSSPAPPVALSFLGRLLRGLQAERTPKPINIGRIRLLRLSGTFGLKRELRFNVPPDALRKTLLQGPAWPETTHMLVHRPNLASEAGLTGVRICIGAMHGSCARHFSAKSGPRHRARRASERISKSSPSSLLAATRG
jgi:hypothetical protein